MTRILGFALLLAAGILSLPLAATFLDGPGIENWILPIQVGAMGLLGGLVGVVLPGFVAGATSRRLAVGAAYGAATAVVGVMVFFLLLSGFDGA